MTGKLDQAAHSELLHVAWQASPGLRGWELGGYTWHLRPRQARRWPQSLQAPLCSLKPLGKLWGQWECGSYHWGSRFWCWGTAVSWNNLLEHSPAHRPFTAEIYRQKASRLHKRN